MTTMRRFKENRVGATLRRFRADRRGTTAAIFGLTLVPLMGFIGSAIDYSQATAARTAMQAAVDGAALALTKEPTSATPAQLQAKGEAVFRSLFKPAATVDDASVMVTRDGRTIRVAASGGAKTSIMQVVGFDKVKIGVEAKAAWGTRRIELALVLDNTGSMASKDKLKKLKEASNDLIDRMEAASPQPGAIRISIVPFNTKVNVGKHRVTTGGGTVQKPWWLHFDGGVARHDVKSEDWTGCVTDRTQVQNLDVSDTGRIDADPSTLHLASYCGEWFRSGGKWDFDAHALAEIRPLTDNFANLRTTVKNMKAEGCTNITIGAAWGLDTLTQNGPMSGGVAAGTADVEKIMILLTDGNNTRNRESQNAGHCNEGTYVGTQIDTRTRKVCETIRDASIRVYAIRVIEGNETLLQECASVKDGQRLYYDVKDASQLQGTFQAIVNEILGTRLTH